MRLDEFFYRPSYRFGRPAWDSDEPRPELKRLIDGRPPGRALDLGCGTGADADHLAQQGWEVVGVDFVPDAIEKARTRAVDTGLSAQFVVGDVTRLSDAGVEGPFDLVMDIGCYHAVPDGRRGGYAAGVAAVTRPGGDLYVAGISDPPASWRLLRAHGVAGAELEQRFGAEFDLADQQPLGPLGREAHFVLYHLVRKE